LDQAVGGTVEHGTLAIGTPCFNCTTPLQGGWCYHCGQRGADYHRSIRHLAWEALEDFFHADSRLWHTLPRLVVNPAKLTREFVAGRRASQVPPLRLYLVAVLVVFLAGEAITPIHPGQFKVESGKDDTPPKFDVHIYKPWDKTLNDWAETRVKRAVAHPDQFQAALGQHAHDMAILTLPISAMILAMLFAFRRGYLVFDHLVFSMHSLSFQGLLFVAAAGLSTVVGGEVGAWMLLSPVHLFMHMRGFYRLGTVGTLVRMTILASLSLVAFVMMMLVLVVVGLESLKG
jgi:hypothetical protein